MTVCKGATERADGHDHVQYSFGRRHFADDSLPNEPIVLTGTANHRPSPRILPRTLTNLPPGPRGDRLNLPGWRSLPRPTGTVFAGGGILGFFLCLFVLKGNNTGRSRWERARCKTCLRKWMHGWSTMGRRKPKGATLFAEVHKENQRDGRTRYPHFLVPSRNKEIMSITYAYKILHDPLCPPSDHHRYVPSLSVLNVLNPSPPVVIRRTL